MRKLLILTFLVVTLATMANLPTNQCGAVTGFWLMPEQTYNLAQQIVTLSWVAPSTDNYFYVVFRGPYPGPVDPTAALSAVAVVTNTSYIDHISIHRPVYSYYIFCIPR